MSIDHCLLDNKPEDQQFNCTQGLSPRLTTRLVLLLNAPKSAVGGKSDNYGVEMALRAEGILSEE
jgi:hypothetical protein